MMARQSEAAPIGDKLYSTIRSDVIFGRLAPGQRLTLDRMRDVYGTSIGTLREVLNRLASEGFVAAGAHCGVKRLRPDLALIATDDGRPAACAAVFTTNGFAAASVQTSRARPSVSAR